MVCKTIIWGSFARIMNHGEMEQVFNPRSIDWWFIAMQSQKVVWSDLIRSCYHSFHIYGTSRYLWAQISFLAFYGLIIIACATGYRWFNCDGISANRVYEPCWVIIDIIRINPKYFVNKMRRWGDERMRKDEIIRKEIIYQNI